MGKWNGEASASGNRGTNLRSRQRPQVQFKTFDHPENSFSSTTLGTRPVLGKSHIQKRSKLKIRNPLDNTDIKGAQVNWNRHHVKEYNPMDYSDVSKLVSERRLRAPNAHQELKPEQLMPHQLYA